MSQEQRYSLLSAIPSLVRLLGKLNLKCIHRRGDEFTYNCNFKLKNEFTIYEIIVSPYHYEYGERVREVK